VCCSGESLDEMRLLEEQARRIAEEANKDKPKTMTFVKSSEASAEMEEMAKVSGANPDEIELGDSGGEEEEGPEPVPEPAHNQKEVEIQEQVVPSAVFGSIPEEMQGAVLGARQRFSLTKKTS
jgi:hypothetical protein